MLDWLGQPLGDGNDVTLNELLVRLLLAFLGGCFVAGVYFVSQRRNRIETSSFVTTLVLLTILIAMITPVIGNSVARAFSLVGALAIVRFRTLVDDTRDMAYVIFAVVIGMAIGAGMLLVPLIGIPVVALASLAMFFWGRVPLANVPESTLVLRVGLGRDPHELLKDVFQKHLVRSRLTGTGTARQGAAFELTYRVRLRNADGAIAFVTDLNQREGVQSVEWRES